MATKFTLMMIVFLVGIIVPSTPAPYRRRHYHLPQTRDEERLEKAPWEIFRRGSCIPLGGTGCENNNGKCCREGNPYTGTMRSCVNKGSFSSPKYTCVA